MRFSVRFNNDLPTHHYPRLAQAAEAAGFHQFWVSDDLFLRGVWPILTACAFATERIQVGTGLVNPYTMHPAEMAMQAAALDELSGGRFNLGLGAGAGDFLAWVGQAQERPLTRTAETLRVLRALFAGERGPFDYEELGGWSEEAYLRFPTRRVPLYVGAMSPKMLRLTGAAADGGLPLLFPPEHFAEVITYVRAGAAEAGRSMDEVDVAACLWVSVAEDRAAAERVLREKIAYYGHALSDLILERLGVAREEFAEIERAVQVEHDMERAQALVTEPMLRIGIVGSAGDLIERLEGLVGMGATHLSFGPPLGPDPMEAIAILGREVLPHFM
ncbi:MAG TPA: LLM class flavin-dependent oxidoreductase [Ardenticatenaceae bacterium]|jgi:5,10-methylenetetrahydromethanopterin reductase